MAVAAVIWSGCVPDQAERVGGIEPRGCFALADVVEALGSRGSPLPVGGEGALVRIPVGTLGDWVIVSNPGAGREATITVLEDGRPTDSVRLVDGCAGEDDWTAVTSGGTEATAPRGGAPTGGSSSVEPERVPGLFTDADLRSVLAANPQGVAVYLWSPHMPLSVDGYGEFRDAASEMGVAVVPLLFTGSDADFARREAERVGMPEEALRTVASAELLLRDAQLHAPSVLLFTPARVSRVLPGYRDAAGYLEWLREQALATSGGDGPAGG